MKIGCFVSVWSLIWVIFLLSLNSEVSGRLCSSSRQFKAVCGKKFLHFPSINGSRKHNRIAGGYDAYPGEYPSFASLKLRRGGNLVHRCGGVLIDSDTILTAGHCFEVAVSKVDVYVGSVNPSWRIPPPAEVHQVASHWCRSPRYNETKTTYDYAIIKLKEHVTLSDHLQTACLPTRSISLSAQAFAVGKGKIDNKDTIPKYVQVLPVETVECSTADEHSTHMCTRSNNPNYVGDTCTGDSGGPIYAFEDEKMVVIGLTSYGPGGKFACAIGTQGTSVNADTFYQREHILELVKNCKNPPPKKRIYYDDYYGEVEKGEEEEEEED